MTENTNGTASLKRSQLLAEALATVYNQTRVGMKTPITPDELFSRQVEERIIYPQQLFMHLLSVELGLTPVEIAELLGGIPQRVVHQGQNHVQDMLKINTSLPEILAHVRETFGGSEED
jgi:hypothetical protein